MNNKQIVLGGTLGAAYYVGTAAAVGLVGVVLGKAALIALGSKAVISTGCLAIGSAVCINDAIKRTVLASACVLTAAEAQVKAKRVA